MSTTDASLREAAAALLGEIDDLIGESHGVYGLHLNGDPAPWDEIVEGGRFERLSSMEVLRAALAQKTPVSWAGDPSTQDYASTAQQAPAAEPVAPESALESMRKILFSGRVVDTFMLHDLYAAAIAAAPQPPQAQPLTGEVVAFLRDLARQKPEKPDYWSSCSQCEANSSKADDLLDGIKGAA